MALKLVKRNKLPVPVKGEFIGEDGKPVRFSFKLLCKRLTQTEMDEELKDKNGSVKAFLLKVTEGWEDMIGEDDAPLSFSRDALDNVLDEHAGLHSVCYQAYLNAVGTTAKN